MDVLMNWTVVIISQCVHVSNYNVVRHFKYIQFYDSDFILDRDQAEEIHKTRGNKKSWNIAFLKTIIVITDSGRIHQWILKLLGESLKRTG